MNIFRVRGGAVIVELAAQLPGQATPDPRGQSESPARRFPDSEELATRTAVALKDAGRVAEATAHVWRMVALDPDDPWTLLNGAELMHSLGDDAQARTLAKKVWGLVDEDWERLADLLSLVGRLAMRKGLTLEAEEAFRAAFELNEEDRDAGQELARFYADQSRPLDALRVLAIALTYWPRDPGLLDVQHKALAAFDGPTP
jgi:tetratricopeptide (TPR) repeat protein